MTKSPLKICNELVESLKQAEGAASQLVHKTGHPMQFVVIRDSLALMTEGVMKIAPHNAFLAPRTIITGRG